MAIFLQNTRQLSMLVSRKNVLMCTKNCNTRLIMTTRPKLEKVLENLKSNPFFDKYANKIAKFQETSPEEFVQRVESQEKKFEIRKAVVHSLRSCQSQSLWIYPFLVKQSQPSWISITKRNYSECEVRSTYITTPIFYVNAGPHIGHTYTAVLADALARFNSMLGHSVFLCTGTDEHGTKVEKAAKTATLPVLEYCTQISMEFQDMCDMFQIGYSDFIRTTEKRHEEAVHHFWNCLEERGHIYLGKYSGWYDISEEAFVSDKEIAQRVSGNTNEAITESGNIAEWTEEDTYKFRLTSFIDDLKYWLQDESVIQPSLYRNTLISWLDDLQDLSISRPIKRVPWAIPTPSNKNHTIYVWLDALVNYLTSVGYPDRTFKKLWPPSIQVIGKDILKFHGIYWPAFLMAAGLEPPRKLLCHGHWLVDDKKMSKSKGNVISPFAAANEFTEDGLRYFLLRQAVPHANANYNAVKIRNVLNAELADTLGNLLNRCFGKSINPNGTIYNLADYKTILKSNIAAENIIALEELGENARTCYEKFQLHHVVDAVMSTLHLANQMFDHHKPWHLTKSEDPDSRKELEAVLSLTLENVRIAGLVLHPIVPRLTSNLFDFLQISVKNRTWEDTRPLHLTNSSNETTHALSQNLLLFRKIKT